MHKAFVSREGNTLVWRKRSTKNSFVNYQRHEGNDWRQWQKSDANTISQQRSETTNVCSNAVPSIFSLDGRAPAAFFVQVGFLSAWDRESIWILNQVTGQPLANRGWAAREQMGEWTLATAFLIINQRAVSFSHRRMAVVDWFALIHSSARNIDRLHARCEGKIDKTRCDKRRQK